nr:hypothetical protein [Candidatus Frankia nodulisporulans]
MADVALDRPEQAVAAPVAAAPERLGEGPDLDRVAHGCRGAVRLDVADRVAVDAGRRVRGEQHLGLAGHRRRGETDLASSVGVHRRTADDRPDPVPVGDGVLEPFEQHRADTLAGDHPGRGGVEGAYVAVG